MTFVSAGIPFKIHTAFYLYSEINLVNTFKTNDPFGKSCLHFHLLFIRVRDIIDGKSLFGNGILAKTKKLSRNKRKYINQLIRIANGMISCKENRMFFPIATAVL